MPRGVTVDVNADIARFSSGIDKAVNKLESFGRRGDAIGRNVGVAFRGIAASIGVVSFVRLQDEAIQLNAILKNASSGGFDFAKSFSDVNKIAASAQVSVGDIGKTYARLSFALADLGTSQQEVADITETLSLALKVGGATAEESASVMLQLSQAFGKGKLDGDEFRSAMEAAPQVMRKLAESLGVPFGALKDLAKQGKITSKVLVEALSDDSYLQSLREQAEETRTVGGALVELKNSLIVASTAFEDATGFSDKLTDSLSALAGVITRTFSKVDVGASLIKDYKKEIAGLEKEITKATQNGPLRVFAKDELTNEEIRAKAIRINVLRAAIERIENRPKPKTSPSSPDIATEEEDKDLEKKLKKQATELQRLVSKFEDAVKPTQEQSVALQELLDNYSNLQPEMRKYLQGLQKQVEQQEIAKKSQEEWNELYELQRASDEEAIRQMEALSAAEENRVRTLEAEADALRKTLDPTIALLETQSRYATLRMEGLITEEEYQKALEKLNKTLDENKSKVEENAEATRELGLVFTAGFEDAIADGKKFSEVLKQIEKDLIKLVIRKSITDPFLEAVGGIDFGSLFGNASGNAFGADGVKAFASGGIVSSPTAFKYNGNKMGVMGEAGEEAILPLGRLSNGDLGVQTNGNGGSSNIVINLVESPGNGGDVSQRDDGDQITLDIMVEKIEAKMGRNINNGAGIAPVLEKQYGVNRVAGAN